MGRTADSSVSSSRIAWLICHGLLEGTRVADRTARDPQTVAWREISRTIREDEALLSAVLPMGNGLLVATKRA